MLWWYNDEIPFVEAAEIGTEKVIKDHSTIGIVVTTDGSIGDFERNSYIEAEEKVISSLKEINKPFIIVLNSTHPSSSEAISLTNELRDKYQVPVMPMDVLSMNEKDTYDILKEALYEFPVLEVKVKMPSWIAVLSPKHYVKESYIEKIKESVVEVDKIRDVDKILSHFGECEYISKAYMSSVDPATGVVMITLEASEELFSTVLNEMIDIDVHNKASLLSLFQDYKESKDEFAQFKNALKMVKQAGYGVANPTISDMKLSKPEIIKNGGRYGIKLKATAPSIHMIRVDVESTFEPIIGSEGQSKELVDYLMRDAGKNDGAIWQSEIFGRSIDSIVQEGIQSKIAMMPENVRYKLQQTMTKIVNKGSGNLIAFVI